MYTNVFHCICRSVPSHIRVAGDPKNNSGPGPKIPSGTRNMEKEYFPSGEYPIHGNAFQKVCVCVCMCVYACVCVFV